MPNSFQAIACFVVAILSGRFLLGFKSLFESKNFPHFAEQVRFASWLPLGKDGFKDLLLPELSSGSYWGLTKTVYFFTFHLILYFFSRLYLRLICYDSKYCIVIKLGQHSLRVKYSSRQFYFSIWFIISFKIIIINYEL